MIYSHPNNFLECELAAIGREGKTNYVIDTENAYFYNLLPNPRLINLDTTWRLIASVRYFLTTHSGRSHNNLIDWEPAAVVRGGRAKYEFDAENTYFYKSLPDLQHIILDTTWRLIAAVRYFHT